VNAGMAVDTLHHLNAGLTGLVDEDALMPKRTEGLDQVVIRR
jgi:hypothetical protein